MNAFNPYAAPQADHEFESLVAISDDSERLWRDGGLLVMDKTASLPGRCVVCNAPASGTTLRRRLAWHAPGWYLLVLLNLGFYVITALIVTKKARISIGLCEAHRKRRRRWMALAISLSVIGFILSFACLAISPDAALVGSACAVSIFLISAVVWIYGTRVVYAKRIDHAFAWIGGVSPEFLAALPEWAGRPRA